VELLDVFDESAPPALRGIRGEALSRSLSDLVARGAAEHPGIKLAPEALIAQAARHLPDRTAAAGLPAALDALCAGELHLACACAQGSPATLLAFEKGFLTGKVLRDVLARADKSPVTADEVRSALREKLLVAAPDRPPRIAEYSGRWPLAGRLRMAAARLLVDLLRRAGEIPAAPNEVARAEELAASVAPVLRHFKERFREPFQQAVNAAFAMLDAESCNLLRLQIVQGLRTAQIAALFRVDRSTIKRRLADCRAQLLDETRRHLQEKLSLSTAEFESLAGLVQSELHLSLDRLVREP